MRILAVIPARKGSKGIPNKNIRLVRDKPLIYYAIENAKNSSLITDIIVSTDSEIVASIARQLGATIHMRDSSLAGDAVTLDSVVYDAIGGGEWDYVVTMQPTSPTLRVETLDKAISHAIESGIDTLISVQNKPHLAWTEDVEGKKIPAYTERKNRQYLKPNYVETGAFLIAKWNAITPTSRVGSIVDVYEVPPDEAIDLDDFGDLLLIEEILSAKKIAIYVNGNSARGTGHVYRALEIADMLYQKPSIFYDKNQTSPEIFGDTTHTLIPVDGFVELRKRLKNGGYNLLISDILDTTVEYMKALKSDIPYVKLINFEDEGEGGSHADLVINALYHKGQGPNCKTGIRYYIAPKLFMLYQPIRVREKVQNVFISFGGSDPQSYTDRLLRLIQQTKYSGYQFTVVLGRIKQNSDELMEYNRFPHIEVLRDVENMPEAMSGCDIAMTSRGRTSYELAILGIPTIVMAQNEREQRHDFISDDNGFYYLGLDPDDATIISALDLFLTMPSQQRRRYQKTLLSHDLYSGRRRVMNLINDLY